MRRNHTKIIECGLLYRIFTSLPTGLKKSDLMPHEEAKKESKKLNKVAKRLWKEHEAAKPRQPFQPKEEE